MENYGRQLVLDLPFDRTIGETIEAFRLEGIDIVTRFDLKEYLNRTLRHDCRRYVLLQATVPQLSLEAVQLDLGLGALAATTVVVFELADSETGVLVAEPFSGYASDPARRAAAPDVAALADRFCEQMARGISRLQRAAARDRRSDRVEQVARIA